MSKDAFAGIPPVGTFGLAAPPPMHSPDILLQAPAEAPASGSVRGDPSARPPEPRWARLPEPPAAGPSPARPPAQRGWLLTSCVHCGRLHAPARPLALHPVCADCAG